MKKTIKSILAGLTALTLVLTAVGCGKDEGKVSINKGSGEIPETISIYAPLPSTHTAVGIKSNNDILTFQELEKLTGCHIDWIHPAEGASGEKFNLMLISDDLPDMIVTSWKLKAQTGQSYAEDGILLPLSDLIEENMPNLSAFLKERPDVKKQFTEEDGEIYYIPMLCHEDAMKVFRGPVIREDWLEKLGLEAPKTPEELYEVLKAFKTQDPNGNGKADEIPMSAVKYTGTSNCLNEHLWMFGTVDGFYLKDGKVTFGVLEDEFEEGVKYLAKLFSEGLIDPDFLLNDHTKIQSKFMNDRVGFMLSNQPTPYYKVMSANGRKVTGISFLAAEGVKNNVFDQSRFRDAANISIAVTTANQNPAGSLKWLDNFYGGEGQILANYGVEGVSFDYVDGKPKIRPEYLVDNKINLVAAANNSAWVSLRDWDYYSQILSPWGREAIETWKKDTGTAGTIHPAITFTPEEKDIITQKYVQIETYVSEQISRMIIGNLSIDEFPAIREQVKKMGIEEIIDIYANALKRYNSR